MMISKTPSDPRGDKQQFVPADVEMHRRTGSSASGRRTVPTGRITSRTTYPSTSNADMPTWGSPASEWNEYRGNDTSKWSKRRTMATVALALAGKNPTIGGAQGEEPPTSGQVGA
ncbi:hypothetical protein [Kocuria sp. TGY1127_2]|uniref:hypothetical protein n=1 Tax=Kocuria sp. TGY1127_2 TaxID=2711328 RepID=UPI0015BF55C6|nr:hypothetical protein [Kocuria sp. TGY1127_2]